MGIITCNYRFLRFFLVVWKNLRIFAQNNAANHDEQMRPYTPDDEF